MTSSFYSWIRRTRRVGLDDRPVGSVLARLVQWRLTKRAGSRQRLTQNVRSDDLAGSSSSRLTGQSERAVGILGVRSVRLPGTDVDTPRVKAGREPIPQLPAIHLAPVWLCC